MTGGTIMCNTATGNGGGVYVGASGTFAVEDCLNEGTVNGAQSIGGIVGYVNNASVTVMRSGNTAAVTGTSYNVGGIVGQSGTTAPALSQCYNTGSVTGVGYGTDATAAKTEAELKSAACSARRTAPGTTPISSRPGRAQSWHPTYL